MSDFFTRERRLPSFLKPPLDEISSYSTALVFCLLLSTDTELQGHVRKICQDNFDIGTIILIAMMSSGIFFSFLDVLYEGRKSWFAKFSVLFSNFMINAFAAIWAGSYLMETEHNPWLKIFPCINMAYGVWLLLCLRLKLVDEKDVPDDDATFVQLLVATMLSVGLFLICRHLPGLNWALTFSICTGYAISASNFCTRLLAKRLHGGKIRHRRKRRGVFYR